MQRLVLVAPLNAFTGYGINTINKMLGLIALGYDPYLRVTKRKPHGVPGVILDRCISDPVPELPWEVIINPPGLVGTPGKKIVYCTTLETTGLDARQRPSLEKAEAIIVPSHWNGDCLVAMGFTKPIYVCPESVDTSIFHYRPPNKSQSVTFGAAGNLSVGDGRKNLAKIVTAFREAFPNDYSVKLKIKVAPYEMVETCKDKRIELITEWLTQPQLADWYTSLDVFVSISSGEAWGRMIHEAAAIGRPVILPLYGGPMDFLPPEAAYPVEFTEEPASHPYEGAGLWAVINEQSLVDQLRIAKLDRAREAKGIRAAQAVSGLGLTWGARMLASILTDLGVIHVQPCSERDIVTHFYKGKSASPKKPVEDFSAFNLTNTPTGIGDMIILTPIPAKAQIMGRTNTIRSASKLFPELSALCPGYVPSYGGGKWIAADILQRAYACGPGHLIQRLQRALRLPVDILPKGYLKIDSRPVSGRVAVHLVPGHHCKWQAEHVHPNARQLSDRSVRVLQQFIAARPWLEFVEIGSEPSGKLTGLVDATGLALTETIHTLSRCEYFLGIMSGPMHLATALGLKCVVLINFPSAYQLILPALVDLPVVELDWAYPQNVHLHQDESGPLIPQLSLRTLQMAFDGEVYPYWLTKEMELISV